MTDPKRVSESVLTLMRTCMHSSIHGASRNLLPDYYCKYSGKLCVLYDKPHFCARRVEFPTSQDL